MSQQLPCHPRQSNFRIHFLNNFFKKLSISDAHGKPQKLTDDVTVFPIYHPAAALHNGNLRQPLFDDFKALKDFLDSQKTSS